MTTLNVFAPSKNKVRSPFTFSSGRGTKRNGAPGINAEIRRKNCTIEILLARSKRGTV